MSTSKFIFKLHLLLFIFCGVLFFSCSKEEKEVTPAELNVPTYDQGHLIIKMNEVNPSIDPSTLVSSIELTNITKGTVHSVNPALFVYFPSGGFSTLTTTFINGNINDQLQCCVEFTSTINVGIGMRFKDVPADSVVISFTNSNAFCSNGTYK